EYKRCNPRYNQDFTMCIYLWSAIPDQNHLRLLSDLPHPSTIYTNLPMPWPKKYQLRRYGHPLPSVNQIGYF
ncbi:hypothetical protein HHI36_012315, partial [Cryptolaemus montrouzieri]